MGSAGGPGLDGEKETPDGQPPYRYRDLLEHLAALRLDLPGARVEVILRDQDLVLRPHVAVRLNQVRDDGTAPAPGSR